MVPLREFEWLSFDCYGTLIDWEAGIATAIEAILARHDVTLARAELLSAYARIESGLEEGPHRDYRAILEDVVRRFGAAYNFTPTDADCASLPASLADWPAFPDSAAALQKLSGQCRLAIISNVDDDLFAASAAKLQVKFDAVITAQQVGSYKPSENNFRFAHERLGVDKERWLHVAQSRFHDIAPARAFGLKTVWVNRQKGRHGATMPSAAEPNWEVPDMGSLAAMLD